MAKSYSEYLQQNQNRAPRTQNPGASGLSYSQVVTNGLQGSLDNGSAYRQMRSEQRAAQNQDREIQRYLQNYYDVLRRATDYASSAPNGGRSVTDYQPIMNEMSQYTNSRNDMLQMIRNAYGANSSAENALNAFSGFQGDISGVMSSQMGYYAGQTPSVSSYAGKSLSEMEEEIQKLQNARDEAVANGRDTAMADRLLRNARNYVQNNLGGLTEGMSSEELRNASDSYNMGFMDQLRNFGTAEANAAGNMQAGLNRLANQQKRTEERTARREARDARIEELLGPMSGNTLEDYEARENQINAYIQAHPIAYSSDAPNADYDQNYTDYEYLSQEYERIHGETERLRRSESLNSILGELPDNSAASLRARLDAANALAEGYVMQTNDITTEQYQNLQEEGKRLADAIWYADIEEAKSNMPSNLLYRLENGEDITKELQDLGYSEDQIENLLYYGKMQRDEKTARERERRLSDTYTRNFGMGLVGTVGTRTAASLTSGLGFADSTFQLVVHPDRPINYNTALNRWANTDEIISEAIMNEVNWTNQYGRDSFDKLYQFASSTLDSVVTGLLTTGYGTVFAEAGLSASTADILAQRIGDAIFFGSAAQSYMRDAVANGATDSQAIMGGLLAGTAEAFFEHFSLEHFYNSAMHRGTLGALAKDYLISAGINGSEEFFTELSNILTDWMVMGDISDVMTKYNELLDAGYTEDEAKRMTVFNMAGRALEAGISGMLQGAVMSTVSTASSAIGTARMGSRLSDAGVALLQERTGRDLASNYERGVAFTEVFEQTRDAMVSDRTIENYLRTSGVTSGDISDMVRIVRKTLADASLTPEEYQIMRRSPEAARAFSALVEENGVQNNNEFNDADALNRRASQIVAQNDANKRLVALAASTGDPVTLFNAAQEAYGSIENVDEEKFTSDSGYEEVLSRGTLSEDAKKMRSNLFAAESARIENENIQRAERNEEKLNPVSEETFSNQFSAAYNTGRAFYDRTEEQRKKVVSDYGEWAGTAFDLGAAEVKNLDLRGAARTRTKGSVSNISQAELQQYFKDGGAIAPYGRNSAELQKMSAEERKAYDRRASERKAVEYIAKAIGAKVVLYESTNESAANGWYDRATGTIYLDVRAGDFGNRSMLRAMAHELTHMIQTRSPSEYNALRQFILDKYFDGKQELLDRRVNEAMQNDPNLKPEYAVDEVIADSCEMMLRDSEAIKQIYNENRSLFTHIKEFIDKVVKAIKEAFTGVDTYSDAANDMREYWGEIQRLWDAGLVASSIQQIEEITATGISEETAEGMVENGLTVEKGAIVSDDVAKVMEKDTFQPPIDDHDVQNSPRTTPAWEKAFDKNYPYLTEEERESVKEAIRAFNEDEVMQAAIGFAADSDPTGFFSNSKFGPLRTNVEYKYTFDMDTSCPRTFQFLAYRDKIQKAIGRPLRYWESQNLLNVMRVTGQNIPCTYCYVENKRILLSASFNNYFKFRNAVMTASSYEDARKVMYGYNEKKDELAKASKPVLDSWWKHRDYNPSAAECYGAAMKSKNLINQELDDARNNGTIKAKASLKSIQEYVINKYGITDKNAISRIKNIVAEWKYDVDAKREHTADIEGIADTVDEKALAVLNEGMAYAKSASSAKNVENYMPYSGQLSNIPKAVKAYIQAMGGLRKHSSNDFRVDYVQDYFLLFADMAAGGWKGHTYTKSVDYVKIFGRTGDRINMSIALNGDTYDTITENSQEGMAWKDAQELRKAYPNAGVMCMVTNDAQLSWALDQDWIDMIIPFHSSGLLKEVWSDIRQWMDYTTKQNESFWTTDEMKSQLRAAKIEVDGVEDIKALYFESLGKTALLEVDEDGNTKYHRPHFFPDDTKDTLKTPSGKRTVTIPGHHNNAARYLELCNQYGVRPRFYNATVTYKGQQIKASEHPNFFKLVKETSRIDGENGTGPQEAIKFNFNEYDEYLGMTPFEYALKRMDEERKNGGFNNAKNDPYGIVDAFLDKKNGFIGANKFVDPAKVPRYATMMEIVEKGFSEWEQNDEDSDVQKSARRSRLQSIDMVEAIDNYDGINENVANALRKVKELYSKYKDNQNEVSKINESLRDKNSTRKSDLNKRKTYLLKTRDNLSSQIDSLMENRGVREFLEAERTELVSLFDESAIAGRDYVNRYYNAPLRESIETANAERERANAEQRRADTAERRYEAREKDWQDRFERMQNRYGKKKLEALQKQAEEMRMSFRERMERQQERMASNALRETARNRLARLVNMLETNNDQTHVITELRGPVARFITALNPVPQNARGRNARQMADSWRQALTDLRDLANNENTSPVTSLIIDQNREAFDRLIGMLGNLESLITDNLRLTQMGEEQQMRIVDTSSRGSTASTIARGTLAADTLAEQTSVLDYMDSEQLTQLNRVLRAVQAIVNSANRVFANAKYATRQQMVDDSHEELDKIDGDPAIVKVGGGKVEQASLQTQRFLAWRNGTPYYVFKRFGSVGKELYMSLAKGWGQMSQDVHAISEAVKAHGITPKQTQKWRENVIDVEIPTLMGKTKTAHVTMAQLMSLYCHFRQEQSLLHINGGGFTFAGAESTRTDYNTYHMSLEEAQALFDEYLPVGSAERETADFLQHYMQTVGARMGNVVTRALYGYEYFNPDEYYFPVRASDDQMADKTSDPTQSLFALLHMTETRARNPRANSKLVVGDIFDIFNSHMADMAKYKNLALPVLDMVNWLNGRTSDGGFIKQDLRKAFGAIQNGDRTSSIAGDYVSKFIRDINATYSGGGLMDQEAGKFLTRMKKAAVAASLRVALQQPFSYTRAMYTMEPKYLLRSLGVHGDLAKNIDEAKRYSGLARAKSEGAFSADLSPTLREQIIGSSDWRDRISEKAIWLAEKMDEVTWGAIWRASKYQVNNTPGHAQPGTDAYFEEVRQVFDEVILSTQVMDGTLTRSEFMRDTTLYSKIMTAFMAEPTLTYNMMLDGIEGVRMAKRTGGNMRKARGNLLRAMGTWAATQIANALITALVDSFRDDDDYERFFDKFADHFGSNLMDNMNPLDGIPLIKTMWELIVATWKGSKSPLGTEFQGITQSVKALRALYDTLRDEKSEANSYGKMSTWGIIYSALQAVSYLSGLPIANFSRTVTGAYNVVAQSWNDLIAPMTGGYLKHISTYDSEKPGYDALFQAEVNGNERRQENLLTEFAAHGIEGDALGKEMRNRTRDAFIDGSIGAQKARDILLDYGYDAESVEQDLNYWMFKRDYPGIEKPTSSMANAYYDTFQNMGIPAPEFAKYWRYIHGEGITQDEVRAYLNSLTVPGNVRAALWHTKYSSEW